MDFRKMGWSDMDWIDLTVDRHQWRALVNTVMNLGKCLSGCSNGGFSRRFQPMEFSGYCSMPLSV
jgi:hypothetical protein